MVKITAEILREKGASCSQVAIFKKEWPHSGSVTLRNCLRAVELGLDIDWFAYHFLSATALEAYLKATATALYKA